MYLLGFDIGSSSVKAALVDAGNGKILGVAHHPEEEMLIRSPQPGWAEQEPDQWWEAACMASKKVMTQTGVEPAGIVGIGIAYQMHGLVCLSKKGAVLRPAIIWCDSRAVAIGENAFNRMNREQCLECMLNSPGNFTASKLKWVQDHEPELFGQIDKIMLPGDYMAWRMTGELCTTVTGLSEGILWDFKSNTLSKTVLGAYGIPAGMIPEIRPVFSIQGRLTPVAAAELGLVAGIPVAYRAGDQPNNALALQVLNPGEVAATGGTSGVVYAVTDRPKYDPEMRVNSFAHVNYSVEKPYTGVLLCINGAGIAYRWARQQFARQGLSYPEIEQLAATVPAGAEGLTALPFGNGAERMLGNANPGATFAGLDFNRHEARHIYRAVLEGIAFSFVRGMKVMNGMGISVDVLRVGNDNLFLSDIFSETIATLMETNIEMMSATGAVGAAQAAGVATGCYNSVEEAVRNTRIIREINPGAGKPLLLEAFHRWESTLMRNFIVNAT